MSNAKSDNFRLSALEEGWDLQSCVLDPLQEEALYQREEGLYQDIGEVPPHTIDELSGQPVIDYSKVKREVKLQRQVTSLSEEVRDLKIELSKLRADTNDEKRQFKLWQVAKNALLAYNIYVWDTCLTQAQRQTLAGINIFDLKELHEAHLRVRDPTNPPKDDVPAQTAHEIYSTLPEGIQQLGTVLLKNLNDIYHHPLAPPRTSQEQFKALVDSHLQSFSKEWIDGLMQTKTYVVETDPNDPPRTHRVLRPIFD